MSLMNLEGMKRIVSTMLEGRAIRVHRSRVGWRIAPRYTRYLDRCRRKMAAKSNAAPIVAEAVETFRREGITSFWTERSGSIARAISASISEREAKGAPVWGPMNAEGYEAYAGDPWIDFPELEDLFRGDLGDFLMAYFKAPYKILHGVLYRTRHVEGPHGSQLWHSDGGPGICVNVMYYLHDTTPQNGTLEAVPWDVAYELFRKERQLHRAGGLEKYGRNKRERLCRFYESEIDTRFRTAIRQPSGPAGLVVPFLNNTVHRGGYPAPGHARTALVFHCYPSHRPLDLERYRANGIKKTMPYPIDPAAVF